MTSPRLTVGIFVGGASTRMGGLPKGLLPAPDGSSNLVNRLLRIIRGAVPQANLVLVGSHTAYATFGIRMLRDSPEGIGPLGGLRSLLEEASTSGSQAMAIACDLPFVTSTFVERVAHHAPDRAAVAPRPGGVWQPLCARYRPADCLPVISDLIAGHRYGLHRLLDALGDKALALPTSAADIDELRDWDAPEEMT